jgi:hypothetical protein
VREFCFPPPCCYLFFNMHIIHLPLYLAIIYLFSFNFIQIFNIVKLGVGKEIKIVHPKVDHLHS